MSFQRNDPRETLREDLLAGENSAAERVRAYLERSAPHAGQALGAGQPHEADGNSAERDLRADLAWVNEVERGLRAAAPDPDLARRICASLPVGRPQRTPTWKRVLRSPVAQVAAAAASVLLIGGLAWVLKARFLDQRAEFDQRTELDQRIGGLPSDLSRGVAHAIKHPFGLVEFRGADDFDPRRRRNLDGDRNEIETKINERASATLDPWFADAISKEPGIYRTSTANSSQTALEVDTASKVVTQLYEDRPAAESWMLGAYELARAYFGTTPVTGPILEIQVVRGSARLLHNGAELELHDADMVLLARQGPPLRVDAAAPAPGEAPDEFTAAPRQTQSPDRGWIEGSVRDQLGRSLERFDITIWRVQEGSGERTRLARETVFFFSTPDGSFVVEGLDPGRYRLGVASPEHVTAVSEEFDVPRGGMAQALELALDSGAPLRGRVLRSTDDEPIANARVRISNPARPWWWTASDTYGEIRTESDGSFVCLNRAAGYDALWIEAEGFASRWVPPVPLGAEGAGAPLELRLEDESVLHGTVSDASGEPRREVEVAIHGLASCFRRRARTDDRGYYRIAGLGRGSYQVAVLDAHGDARSTRLVDLGVAHVLREDFGGARARVLRGTLRDASGAALDQHKLLFYERSADGALRFAPRAVVTSSADGSFELELPPNAAYRVRVEAADESWSADLRDLSAEDLQRTVNFEWSLRSGGVHGSLRFDEPDLANALRRGGRVVLRSLEDESREWRSALQEGHFHFHAVPAGRYRVYARIRGLYVAAREIEVGAARDALVLEATRSARVELIARDEQGAPVLDIAAWQMRAGGEHRLRTRATPLGLLVEDLPAESIDLIVRAEGFKPHEVHIDLARDGAPRVELELTPR